MSGRALWYTCMRSCFDMEFFSHQGCGSFITRPFFMHVSPGVVLNLSRLKKVEIILPF